MWDLGTGHLIGSYSMVREGFSPSLYAQNVTSFSVFCFWKWGGFLSAVSSSNMLQVVLLLSPNSWARVSLLVIFQSSGTSAFAGCVVVITLVPWPLSFHHSLHPSQTPWTTRLLGAGDFGPGVAYPRGKTDKAVSGGSALYHHQSWAQVLTGHLSCPPPSLKNGRFLVLLFGAPFGLDKYSNCK